MQVHDDKGRSPFPRLSRLAAEELAYCLCYLDRFVAKTEGPVAVLKEFWEEQEEDFPAVFAGNSLSKL